MFLNFAVFLQTIQNHCIFKKKFNMGSNNKKARTLFEFESNI